MNKKILLASAIIFPSLAAGGLWIYQASLFENSITHQISEMQETLKAYDVSFRYEALRVSRYLFKAHLVNPTISFTMPKFPEGPKGLEILETLEGLQGTALVKGEIIASFSPIMNTVTLKTDGECHLNVQGPLDLIIDLPKPKESCLVIQRKEYDLFGKNAFLSIYNIKGIESNSKELSLLLDGQKLFDIKDASGQLSINWNDKAFDASVSSYTQQIQFFKMQKGIKGKLKEMDAVNANLLSEIEMQAALGPQNHKITASFHLNDLMTYINDLKVIINDASNKPNPQVLEKLLPVGTRFDLQNYSVENNVYQSTMKASVENVKGNIPIKLSGDFKVTDQWTSYWKTYYKNVMHALADAKLPDDFMAVLKRDDISTICLPQLQTFGKMVFSMDFEVPSTLAFTEGKGSLEFKSDLYDFAAVGSLNNEGGTVKVTTRNAGPMMMDLENYFTRVSQPFSQLGASEIQNIHGFVKGGRMVLDKILEPAGAVQQSVAIKVNKEGIKIGNYDIGQIVAIFGKAIGGLEMPNSSTASS